MGTELHWIDGAWPGRLAVSARPRGGDWLEDEMADWQRAGVNTVLSLLTPEEEETLELKAESREVQAHGMNFMSLPIPDRQVPSSEAKVASTLEKINGYISAGKNVAVHCRQGVGRSGLVAACFLIGKGIDPKSAIERVRAARNIDIPETPEQRLWIEHYAATLAGTK